MLSQWALAFQHRNFGVTKCSWGHKVRHDWAAELKTLMIPLISDLCTDLAAAAATKSLQSCPTLCDPIDSSPPGSPVPRILQARTLEWVAISSSNAWMWKVKVKSLSHVRLKVTPWTAAHQAPPSMGLSRQECWSGVPLPSPVLILAIFNFQVCASIAFCLYWIIGVIINIYH